MIEKFEKMNEAATTAFKEGMEKATASFGDVSEKTKANVEAFVASSQILGKGVQEVATTSGAYAKTAYEATVEAAKSLGSAKSFQEVVELQADYAKSSIAAWMTEVNKVTEIMTATSKEAAKPVSERVSVMAASFSQAAQ